MTDWMKLKVADLRAELKERGLATTGLKAELVARLNASEEEEEDSQYTEEEIAQPDADPKAEREEEDSQYTEEEIAQPDVDLKTERGEEDPEVEESPPAQPEEPTPAGNADPAETSKLLPDADTSADTPAEPTHVKPDPVKPTPVELAPVEPQPDPEPTASLAGQPALAEPEALDPTAPAQTISTESPKFDTPEVLRDAQKRKRSASPPRSVHDTKRTKVDAEEDLPADVVMDGMADAALEPDIQSDPKAEPGNQTPPRTSGNDPDDDTSLCDALPAVHPPTSALYIKNFMRPLHLAEFKTHLIELAAAPGAEPDAGVIVDYFLDMIRTHALVQFSSTAIATRVRESLHDTVFPKESNRKALWVDYIPADLVEEWIDREEREPRGSSTRFEVLYEESDDGVRARLLEIGAVSNLNNARSRGAPQEATAAQPPTGPRIHPGVEGAPLAPRADHQRGGRGGPTFRTPRINDPSTRNTRVDPMLYWKPIPDDLAQRRIESMRRFYKPDARVTDDDKRNDINRYFFENGDSFVDRGKEIFAGIRPPHREREHRRMMREQRTQGGNSRLLDPTRRDRNAAPAPQSFRPGGGDRYMGSAARGDSWRDGDTYSRRDERRYRDTRGRLGPRRR